MENQIAPVSASHTSGAKKALIGVLVLAILAVSGYYIFHSRQELNKGSVIQVYKQNGYTNKYGELCDTPSDCVAKEFAKEDADAAAQAAADAAAGEMRVGTGDDEIPADAPHGEFGVINGPIPSEEEVALAVAANVAARAAAEAALQAGPAVNADDAANAAARAAADAAIVAANPPVAEAPTTTNTYIQAGPSGTGAKDRELAELQNRLSQEKWDAEQAHPTVFIYNDEKNKGVGGASAASANTNVAVAEPVVEPIVRQEDHSAAPAPAPLAANAKPKKVKSVSIPDEAFGAPSNVINIGDATAHLPSARVSVSAASGKVNGRMIRGDTGPEVLLYPLVMGVANGAVFLARRKRKDVNGSR